MSQQFWVKVAADGQEYGPYSGADLKKFAAEGNVARESLVSTDHVAWHAARRVDWLWPAQAPAVPTMAPAAPQASYAAAPVAAAVPVGYYTPPQYGAQAGDYHQQIQPRSVRGFVVVAVLMFLAAAVVSYVSYGRLGWA